MAALVVVAVWGEVDDGRFSGSWACWWCSTCCWWPCSPPSPGCTPTRRAAHRLRLVLASGQEVEMTVRGRDFAGAVATAVHRAERDRGRVVRVERLDETG